MISWLKFLKIWQGYPAAVSAAISPWIKPFQQIDLINNLWRPGIDVIADVVAVSYVLSLMAQHSSGGGSSKPQASLTNSVIAAFVLGICCYAMKKRFIHLVDPDYLWIASPWWGLCYVLILTAIARAVFYLMVMIARGP